MNEPINVAQLKNQPAGEQVNEDKHRQNALRLGLVIAVMMVLVSIGVVWVSVVNQVDPSEVYITGLLAIVATLMAWLSWKNRTTLGVLILVGTISLIPLVAPLITDQRSIQIGIITIIITAGVSVATLPARIGGRAIVAVAITAILGVLIDYFLPTHHATTSEPVTNITLGVALVIFGYFILRDYGRFGMRAKLIIAFVAVAMIPLVMLAIVNNLQTSRYLTEASQSSLLELADTTANQIDDYLRNELYTIRVESQLPDFVEILSLPADERANSEVFSKVQEIITRYARRDPVFIKSYALIDSKGNNVQDSNPQNLGQTEVGQEYFVKTTLSGYPSISHVLFEDIPSLYIASPVRGSSGEIIGVLRVKYDARVLQAVLLRNQKSETRTKLITLLDDTYYVRLADSRDRGNLFSSVAPLTEMQVSMLQNSRRLPGGEFDDLSGDEPGIVEGILNSKLTPIFVAPAKILGGVDALTISRHLEEAPWLVLVRQSVIEAKAPVETQTRLAVFLSLAALVLIAGVALLVSQSLSAPVAHLTQVAEQVASGDLHAQARVDTQDEIGALAKTFNSMTNELRGTLEGLEQRVADRTRAIKLSADVSRRLSTILDPSQLVAEVVQSLQQAFDYYHVHIYLFDEAKANLVMVGGTGDAGRIMLERGHTIPAGKGLVGRAAQSGTAVLVPDTSQDPDWLPNPLLPETKAEISVPILLGDEVLGALDVQENTIYGLGRDDIELLFGVASQVAIALNNARRYSEAQNRARRESMVGQIIQQIQSTHSVESALQVAARELGRSLGVKRTRALVNLNPETDISVEKSGNGKAGFAETSS